MRQPELGDIVVYDGPGYGAWADRRDLGIQYLVVEPDQGDGGHFGLVKVGSPTDWIAAPGEHLRVVRRAYYQDLEADALTATADSSLIAFGAAELSGSSD